MEQREPEERTSTHTQSLLDRQLPGTITTDLKCSGSPTVRAILIKLNTPLNFNINYFSVSTREC